MSIRGHDEDAEAFYPTDFPTIALIGFTAFWRGSTDRARPQKPDRAVIDPVRHRLSEAGVLGEVGAPADLIHRDPRQAQLLLAARIKHGNLGDSGSLAQEPQAIEPPLLHLAQRPRQLHGPADLASDLVDEVADRVGGRIGLKLQHAGKQGRPRAAVSFLCSERRSHRSRNCRAADERDQLAPSDIDGHASLQ